MSEEEKKLEEVGAEQGKDMFVTVHLHFKETDGEDSKFTITTDTNIPPLDAKDEDGIKVNPNYTAMRALLYGCVKSLSRVHPDYQDLQEETIDKMTDVLMNAEAESINRYISEHPEEFKSDDGEE